MKQPTGSPPLYLASSVTEKTLVDKSDERLQSILATLEQCRPALVKKARPETAKLVSLAILDLRIDLAESGCGLKALWTRSPAGARAGRKVERSELPGPAQARRVKLVK